MTMADWQIDAILDEQLSAVPPAAGSLVTAMAIDPLPAQRYIAERTIADAASAGLVLPPSIDLRFVHRSEDMPYGCASVDGGRFRITIGHDAPPGDLARLVRHECQHIADFYSGDAQRVSRAEFERRAIRFAASGVPEPPV